MGREKTMEERLVDILEELAYISEKCGETNNFLYLENIEFAFQHVDLALFKAKSLEESPTLQ